MKRRETQQASGEAASRQAKRRSKRKEFKMRKLLASITITIGAALAFSFAVRAQNAAQNPVAPASRKETVPWNKPEAPRTGAAPAARAERPGLFFREDFKVPKATYPDPCCMPFTPESLTGANLELKFYGAGKDMTLVGVPGDDINPLHVWSGLCPTGCAMALRDKNNFVDLTKGKIRWIYKTSGFHVVRPIIKLADGEILIGDHADAENGDWRTSEFFPSELRWLPMDPDRASGWGNWIAKPDLTKVDEIGWVDMMAGAGHNNGGWADVANIEVYGKPVNRSTVQSQLNK